MSTRDVAQRLGCIRSSNQPGVRRNVQQSSVSLPQASKTVVSSTLAVQRHGQTTGGAASALPSTSATDRLSSTRQIDSLTNGWGGKSGMQRTLQMFCENVSIAEMAAVSVRE